MIGRCTVATATAALRMPEDLAIRYDRLAKSTGRTKTFYMTEALAAEIDRLEYEYGLVTCSHPPCNFAARGGGFSLKATDVASIDELSPCAPRFRFL